MFTFLLKSSAAARLSSQPPACCSTDCQQGTTWQFSIVCNTINQHTTHDHVCTSKYTRSGPCMHTAHLHVTGTLLKQLQAVLLTDPSCTDNCQRQHGAVCHAPAPPPQESSCPCSSQTSPTMPKCVTSPSLYSRAPSPPKKSSLRMASPVHPMYVSHSKARHAVPTSPFPAARDTERQAVHAGSYQVAYHAKMCDVTLPVQQRLTHSQRTQVQGGCNTLQHQLSNHQTLQGHSNKVQHIQTTGGNASCPVCWWPATLTFLILSACEYVRARSLHTQCTRLLSEYQTCAFVPM